MRKLLLRVVVIAMSVGSTSAQATDEKAQAFIHLFATTCLKYFSKPDELKSELAKQGMPRIPADSEEFFLSGQKGQAWRATNAVGEYVIALSENGVCAVFARRAKDTDVQQLFTNLVEVLPVPPMMVKKEKDRSSMTPNGPTRYVSYAYGKEDATALLHFALTTASSDFANLQAMASLSMVRNESPGEHLSFDEAYRRSKAQRADVVDAYSDKWDSFNNSNHLDEKNGCYKRDPGPIQQVLVLDASGIVTDAVADVDNAKSRCFRFNYLHVQFPPPPFAPYYVYLRME